MTWLHRIIYGRRDRIRELESRLFDTEQQLYQAEQFERIASGKLDVWVTRHDTLLGKYKELQALQGSGGSGTATPR